MTTCKLIVGLGNPGPEYQNTRHNAGQWFVEQLANKFGTSLKTESKFFGNAARIVIGSQELRLLIPTTYMNKSGQATAAIANFYRVEPTQILVAHDELDMPPGIAKFKQGGGHGGHNGLRDIISCLGNNKQFLRLRIGIGHPGHKNKVTGYVLGKAPANEKELIDAATEEAISCTEFLVNDGLTKAMQHLHSFDANKLM